MKYKVGERIRSIRETLNLMQKDFAQKLGISPPTLSDLETGKSKPSFDVLVKLSEQFKINLYYVVFGKGDMFENPILEFLINIKEDDMAVKTKDVKKFLEHFGKSRRLQYQIMNQYEEKILDSRRKVQKEIDKSE